MPKSKDCPQDTDFLQYVPTKFQHPHATAKLGKQFL